MEAQLLLSSWHAGDLSKPRLGLEPEVYCDLAQTLDTIIHNGALVNHAFTYEQLFEPNVLGSLQVTIPCEFVTAMANIRYWEHDGQLHAFCHTWFGTALSASGLSLGSSGCLL